MGIRVVLFGASGMVGQGVLRECLTNPKVLSVTVVTRQSLGQIHEKLTEIKHDDYLNLGPIENRIENCDACFYALGITSIGTSEPDYVRVTYDFTAEAVRCMLRLNPNMTFVFVSASGADASEKGRVIWARVKGKAENKVQQDFINGYVFRPFIIQPLHGITSRTKLYRVFYALTAPLIPIWTALFPKYVTTTERLGQAMIRVATHGAQQRVLHTGAINQLAKEESRKS